MLGKSWREQSCNWEHLDRGSIGCVCTVPSCSSDAVHRADLDVKEEQQQGCRSDVQLHP